MIEDRGEQPYVSVTKTVTRDHVAPVADQLPGIIGRLAGQQIPMAGAPFFRYRVIDLEHGLLMQVGVPTSQLLADAGELEADMLPAGRYVTTTYTGRTTT